ncbi:MAG: NAD(P)/FAD-dependent oxidoreductase [Streptosporangiaceae bacterium]
MSTVADVLVVGGGPAGLATAVTLRNQGIGRVVVIEREPQAGGIPRHSAHTGYGLRDLRRLLDGPGYARTYVRLAERAGVELRTEASATGWAGPTTLRVTSPEGVEEIEAEAIVLATGCRERPRTARLVPGTRPQGVFTTGSLQQFVHLQQLPVGRRALIVGAEHVSFSAVLTLAHAGSRVVAMVTEHPVHQTYAPLRWVTASRHRVPVLTEWRVARILGRHRVEAVDLTHVRTGAVRQIACDTVVFTGDWIPDHELARLGRLVIDPGTRGPWIDAAQRTSSRGVFAAGNLLHAAQTADQAALCGREVAKHVVLYLRSGQWQDSAPIPVIHNPPVAWVSPNALPRGSAGVPHGHFIMRVDRRLDHSVLRVVQGDRVLWSRSYRRLRPALPIYVPQNWVASVHADTGPVSIEVM